MSAARDHRCVAPIRRCVQGRALVWRIEAALLAAAEEWPRFHERRLARR